jgi:hypothetical protein
MFSSFANILSKAKDIYQQTKPFISAAKGFLPQDGGILGTIRSGLETVGYGTGAGTGAGTGGGRRRGLSARLM